MPVEVEGPKIENPSTPVDTMAFVPAQTSSSVVVVPVSELMAGSRSPLCDMGKQQVKVGK